MDVILLESIRNLGELGEQVSVKAGFGRNYLLPQGKAVPANAENVAKVEARRADVRAAMGHRHPPTPVARKRRHLDDPMIAER